MQASLRAFVLCMVMLFATSFAGAIEQNDLLQPLGPPGRYTFSPNQLAGAEWYKPAGEKINGHLEESFGDLENWSKLHHFLQVTHGAFGGSAAEIGFLNSGWLLGLRHAGIRFSSEMSAWSQCVSGRELAEAELFGRPIGGRNVFQTIFRIQDSPDRSNPSGNGWFYTKDEKDYAPDELVLDHRILVLLPYFDNMVLLSAKPSQRWEAVKDAARRDRCPAAEKFHPSVDRLAGLMLDYVDYFKAMAQKFPDKPAFSFHWSVNPGWEWGDEQCLDSLRELHPDAASFNKAFRFLEKPCHRDTVILSHLLDTLCEAGACPATVFMDIDLHYLAAYSLDVLRRDREVLRKHHIAFGIDLADECNEQAGCVQVATGPKEMRLEKEPPGDASTENIRDQESLVNKFKFLVENRIIDRNTHVRFEAWSIRPFETGEAASENTKGSFANTVLLLTREFITPRGWDVVPKP